EVVEQLPEAGAVDAPSPPSAPDASEGGSAPPTPFFADDFQRDASPSLGNGWMEKTDEAWELADRRALKLGSGRTYRDNVCYRPEIAELDVDIAEEFVAVAIPTRSTSIHARIQKSTVGVPQTLDSYCLFILNDEVAVIGRQSGTTVPAAERASFRFE